MTALLAVRPPPFRADIAIDLGTANTLVVERGAGMIFNEPSMCCFANSAGHAAMIAAGVEARAMLGRATSPMHVAMPLRSGVLSDMRAAREFIRFAIARAGRSWHLRRLRALIGVPADATQAERQALMTAAADAGLGRTRLLPEPLMAAIGAGLAVDDPRGRMVLDCGAGTTEVAVISLGSICHFSSVRIGGETLNEAIADHLHLNHRFQIGATTAETVKLDLAAQLGNRPETGWRLCVSGKDVASGLPRTISIPASELVGVYERHVQDIVDAVRSALGATAPELSMDILEDGITLTGGASMVGLLGKRIHEATGLKTAAAADPLVAVATGLAAVLEAA